MTPEWSRSIPLNCKGVSTLEGEACVELNLAPSTDSGEYSADVVGKTTLYISEHGVSVSSQRERTLRVTRNCKIRMIEQIVGLRAESNLRAFRQLKSFLQRQIKLREPGPVHDVSASIAELTEAGTANAFGLNQHDGVPTLLPFGQAPV